jgi:eukaryotic-like serine/threonine-protein kinase
VLRERGCVAKSTGPVLDGASVTSEDWQRVKELFEAAAELGPTERAGFLAQACADNEEIRREVTSLLATHDADSGFMNEPVGNLLAAEKPMLTKGQRFGPYEEISLLGEGGMGQVYLAVDTRLRRKVALKLLPSSYMHDADRVRRLEQEAQAASALNHPNIVTIHEIGQTDSLHFIATEFVDGETLREHITKRHMTVGEVLDVGAQVASALQAAHEAGIVHRDIKPENIMLRRDGFVKVLDFGLAKLSERRGEEQTGRDGEERHALIAASPLRSVSPSLPLPVSPSVTSPGVIMGTVAYMSPEQARGQAVDALTDIWSLGIVLYEMVAGRAPFEGETPSQLISSILESPPRPLSLDPEVPAELSRIIAKTLSKVKSERYQSASDLGFDLKNLKEELTVESRLKQFDPKRQTNDSFSPTETIRESPISTVHGLTRQTASVEYFVGEIKRHKTLAGTALLILLVTALGLTYSAINRKPPDLGVHAKKSIAVLPLKPINAADRDALYEAGIADSLIHRLSSMKGFVVRQLSATRGYTDIAQDPIAAGKEQRVDYVLAGNYQPVGGKIRITAQLFNVTSEQLEQTYQFDIDSSNPLAMRDAIATEVENKLLKKFATTSNRQTARQRSSSEEAYRLYLQGMYLADNRNLADAQKAVAALNQAVQIDPNYALAWARLGYAHRTVSNYTSSVSPHDTYQKSIEAINRALTLDENLSEAHSALCENKFLYEWDFAGAERECKRALELDPNSPQGHEIFSRYLMGRGRHDEAIAEIKTAIDLEPKSRFFHHIYGRGLFYARRFSEAAAQFESVVAMDQNYLQPYAWLTSTWALLGNESKAFEWFLKLLALRKVDDKTVELFKTVFQTSGWNGVLREYVQRLDTAGGNNLDGAAYNAQIGNKDKAFEFLEKVYQRREYSMNFIQVDPRLDNLLDDPRFAELVRRVESK